MTTEFLKKVFFERKMFFIDDEYRWQRNSRENSLSKMSYFKWPAGNSLSLFLLVKPDGSGILRETLFQKMILKECLT